MRAIFGLKKTISLNIVHWKFGVILSNIWKSYKNFITKKYWHIFEIWVISRSSVKKNNPNAAAISDITVPENKNKRLTTRTKWNERTRCFSRVNDAWMRKFGSGIGSLSYHMWIARASTFRHVSPGRESRLGHLRGYALFFTRRRAVIPQTGTTIIRYLLNPNIDYSSWSFFRVVSAVVTCCNLIPAYLTILSFIFDTFLHKHIIIDIVML